MPFQNLRLSQVFLRDVSFAEPLLELADFSGKRVLEIGAGEGVVTEYLAARAKTVTALEVDARLAAGLKQKFQTSKNVTVVQADALAYPLDSEVIVGFLPYHLSSPLLFRILEARFQDALLCLQKEFAQRLVAAPGSNDWSRLSVMAQNAADIQFLGVVPRTAFAPMPKVDSALVHLLKNPKFPLDEPLVSCLFQHKNQTVKNALWHSRKKIGVPEARLKLELPLLPFASEKPRSLPLEQLALLSKAYRALLGGPPS